MFITQIQLRYSVDQGLIAVRRKKGGKLLTRIDDFAFSYPDENCFTDFVLEFIC